MSVKGKRNEKIENHQNLGQKKAFTVQWYTNPMNAEKIEQKKAGRSFIFLKLQYILTTISVINPKFFIFAIILNF